MTTNIKQTSYHKRLSTSSKVTYYMTIVAYKNLKKMEIMRWCNPFTYLPNMAMV